MGGSLATGSGVVTLKSSEATGPLPVTWTSRTARSEGKTSPEASATVTFAQVEGGFKVASSALTVKGTVPGADEAAFKEAAQAAKDGCPISGALKGNVALSVEATLA
jgi:osmotically inducible protein OsmC